MRGTRDRGGHADLQLRGGRCDRGFERERSSSRTTEKPPTNISAESCKTPPAYRLQYIALCNHDHVIGPAAIASSDLGDEGPVVVRRRSCRRAVRRQSSSRNSASSVPQRLVIRKPLVGTNRAPEGNSLAVPPDSVPRCAR